MNYIVRSEIEISSNSDNSTSTAIANPSSNPSPLYNLTSSSDERMLNKLNNSKSYMEIYGNLIEYNKLTTYLNEIIEFNEKIASKND